ncbi:hypothetical protein [Methylobacterium segetis]|nr:hypothetical protein [Methylobacterium segetis]
MRRLLAAALITVVSLPALAQPSDKGTAARSRNVTTAGVTKPPGAAGASASLSPAIRGEMAKAEKAAAARDRAWDTKMRTTMGSICRGC